MIVKFPNGAVAAAAIAAVGIQLVQSDHEINIECEDHCALLKDSQTAVNFWIEEGNDLAYAEVVSDRADHTVKTQAEFEKIIPLITAEIINDAGTCDDHGESLEDGAVDNSDDFGFNIYEDGAVRVGCMTFPSESADKVLVFAEQLKAGRKPRALTDLPYENDGNTYETDVKQDNGSLRFTETHESLEIDEILKLGKLRAKLVGKVKKVKEEKFERFGLFA